MVRLVSFAFVLLPLAALGYEQHQEPLAAPARPSYTGLERVKGCVMSSKIAKEI